MHPVDGRGYNGTLLVDHFILINAALEISPHGKDWTATVWRVIFVAC